MIGASGDDGFDGKQTWNRNTSPPPISNEPYDSETFILTIEMSRKRSRRYCTMKAFRVSLSIKVKRYDLVQHIIYDLVHHDGDDDDDSSAIHKKIEYHRKL